MKFIHAADVHLGAKMDSRLTRESADQRRIELRNTFKRMAEFARENEVRAILLSGDVFDRDCPFKKDKDFFYSVVKNTPEVDFLYLKGNHDSGVEAPEELPENLKTFSAEWTCYSYEDVVIAGIEMAAENCLSLYSTLRLEKDKKNIVMLHGTAGEGAGKDLVCLKKLQNKYIDYLALGHIHKPQAGTLDERGKYAYPGCLEGRGFDEAGEHGFLLLDVGEKIEETFYPFAERKIYVVGADVSGAKDAYDAYRKVKNAVSFDKRYIYRVELTGEVDLEVDLSCEDIAKYLESDCFFADVKDGTVKKFDGKLYEGDISLRGEFVRTVLSEDIPDGEKCRIIALGLKALKGEKVEL